MMSEQPANADSLLEEQLVAYLDGELDAQASQQIEERLATDPEVRETLQRLDRTWELLDELDRPDIRQRFTQTTLEMVTSAAAEEVKQFQDDVPRRLRRRWIVALGGLLVSGLAGFVAVALLAPDPDGRLIEDLPVLQNLDQYRQIDDVRFLQMLHEQGLFAQEEADGQ